MLVYEITDLSEEAIPDAPDFRVEPRRPGNRGRIRGYNLIGPDGETQRFSTKREAIRFGQQAQRDLNLRSALNVPERGRISDPLPTGKDKKIQWMETDANGNTRTRTGTASEYADELDRRNPGSGDRWRQKFGVKKAGWFRRIGTIVRRSPFFQVGTAVMGYAIWDDFNEEIAVIEATLDQTLNENLPESVKMMAKQNATQTAVSTFWTMQIVNVIGQIAAAAAAPTIGRRLAQWARPMVQGARVSPSTKWNPWVIAGWLVAEVGLFAVESWIKSDDAEFVQAAFAEFWSMLSAALGYTWGTGVAVVDAIDFDGQAELNSLAQQYADQMRNSNNTGSGNGNSDSGTGSGNGNSGSGTGSSSSFGNFLQTLD